MRDEWVWRKLGAGVYLFRSGIQGRMYSSHGLLLAAIAILCPFFLLLSLCIAWTMGKSIDELQLSARIAQKQVDASIIEVAIMIQGPRTRKLAVRLNHSLRQVYVTTKADSFGTEVAQHHLLNLQS